MHFGFGKSSLVSFVTKYLKNYRLSSTFLSHLLIKSFKWFTTMAYVAFIRWLYVHKLQNVFLLVNGPNI